jgi:hypothetical protein
VKEAEALAIRALCYFYLVRVFRDVPWVEQATLDDTTPLVVAQSDPDIILEKITNDLLKAEGWALETYAKTADTKGRMTKDAIRAILADVYLWQGKYAECITYCDKLINAKAILTDDMGDQEIEGPKYELIEDDGMVNPPAYSIFYQGNSSESIFELQFSQDKANSVLASYFYDAQERKTGRFRANILYTEIASGSKGNWLFLSSDDMRRSDYIDINSASSSGYPLIKYVAYKAGISSTPTSTTYSYSYKTTTSNWIFYRITDVMLMKAEALVQQQATEENLRAALHLVNTTYMRSNPTLLLEDSLAYNNYNSAATLEKLILAERQRELLFEGKRWFDLVRHSERKGTTDDLVEYVLSKYTENQSTISSKLGVLNALYMPIHADELKVNPLLKQNPYYITSSNIVKN